MGAATVLLPPAAFLQATAEGEAALSRAVPASATAGAKIDRRFVRRRRAFRAAACRYTRASLAADDDDAGARRAQARRGNDARAQTRHDRAARSVQKSARHGRTQPLRCRRVRSAAPGRPGAIARACRKPRPRHRRGLVQSGNVCARHAASDRRRLSARGGHAGRSIPLFAPMSRSSPGWKNSAYSRLGFRDIAASSSDSNLSTKGIHKNG